MTSPVRCSFIEWLVQECQSDCLVAQGARTMSDSEESSSLSDEEEQSAEEEPVSALPPQADLEEEGPESICASPAFQCLDEVISQCP
ncbi:hypothetical protein SKAU_G00028280 [Synaphobranchus kaupii]|uniref:Uncharacterized protein n=1 Tax=Synaphobranchus kaupii TaxID=118154 RepID=A0A9Q1JEQ7_SYNKA|nr:hypothetical protein SKAU_G00028280 [Synaphobranchus kaupii]